MELVVVVDERMYEEDEEKLLDHLLFNLVKNMLYKMDVNDGDEVVMPYQENYLEYLLDPMLRLLLMLLVRADQS